MVAAIVLTFPALDCAHLGRPPTDRELIDSRRKMVGGLSTSAAGGDRRRPWCSAPDRPADVVSHGPVVMLASRACRAREARLTREAGACYVAAMTNCAARSRREGGSLRPVGSPDVLHVDDVPVPVPAAGQVRVKVAATSVNLSDWECLRGSPAYARIGGLRRPAHRTLGSDIAGVVDDVGEGVTGDRPGDEVYGDNLALMGGFARVCARAGVRTRHKPPTARLSLRCRRSRRRGDRPAGHGERALRTAGC